MEKLLLTASKNVNKELIKLLRNYAFQAVSAPLLEVEELNISKQNNTAAFSHCRAMLLTSRYAVSAAERINKQLSQIHEVYLVGEQLALQAENAGLNITLIAENMTTLATKIISKRSHLQNSTSALLYLRGETISTAVASLLSSIKVEELICYRTHVKAFDSEIINAINHSKYRYIIVHSVTAAKQLQKNLRHDDVNEKQKILSYSPRITEALPSNWQSNIITLPHPTREELTKQLSKK